MSAASILFLAKACACVLVGFGNQAIGWERHTLMPQHLVEHRARMGKKRNYLAAAGVVIDSLGKLFFLLLVP